MIAGPAYAERVSRSRRYHRVILLSLPLLAAALGVAVGSACGTFDASDAPAAAGEGGAAEAAPGDASGGADGPALDADPDAAPTGCQGGFKAPVVVTLGSGLGASLRSVRGTPSGTFLVSYDTSPDDDMATATLTGSVLTLSNSNPLGALNTPKDETSPTATDDLNLVVFASTREAPDAGPPLFWITEFSGAGGYGAAALLPVAGIDASAGQALNNPYLVGSRIFFDVDNELRFGDLVKVTKKVLSSNAIPGAGTGTHPVVTRDQHELYYQTGAGIQRATRGVLPAYTVQDLVIGSSGAYPTWISDDACHLYAIRTTGSGRELVVFDRMP